MKPDGRVAVGSRRSKLAMLQSRSMIVELSSIHPGLEFDLVEITTMGDRHRDVSLEVLGGEGVFVKELEEALLDGRIDMAVHSAKDMPTEVPDGLCLAATPRRVDPRDVFVSRSGRLADLAPGASIGTGSQRRAVQIAAQRPDLDIRGLRGNVDTRLKKVSSGVFDGILLAAAALIRLGLEEHITEYLSPDVVVPAVAQGSLGIETRAGDDRMAGIVAPLNHEPTWHAVIAERVFLKALGGGCRAPIAAFGSVEAGRLYMRGMVADPAGKTILRHDIEGNASDPEETGNVLAHELIEMGAADLVRREC
jgi:hydroxymethylbilane synthase